MLTTRPRPLGETLASETLPPRGASAAADREAPVSRPDSRSRTRPTANPGPRRTTDSSDRWRRQTARSAQARARRAIDALISSGVPARCVSGEPLGVKKNQGIAPWNLWWTLAASSHGPHFKIITTPPPPSNLGWEGLGEWQTLGPSGEGRGGWVSLSLSAKQYVQNEIL